MTHAAISQQTLSRLSDWLATSMGLSFPPERRDDLERGMAAAAPAFGMSSAESCAKWLLSAAPTRGQIETLASCLTVGETYFFRDEYCFHALETSVLPELIQARTKQERRLRIWSAGCCTGEEPYSIAMLLDRLLPDAHAWHVSILATDINPSFLAKASAGVYPKWSFRSTSVMARSMAGYFRRLSESRYEVKPGIRQHVSFSYLNLADDVYPSMANNTNAMDIIICRNVIQYFTAEQAQRVCGKFQGALVEGGWLIVAPAETWVQPRRGLKMVEFPGAIFYRKLSGESEQAPIASPLKMHSKSAPFLPPSRAGRTLAKALDPKASQPRQASVPAAIEAAEKPVSYRQARDYANQGRLAEAAECCETALAANRVDPIPHYLLAVIRQEQGHHEQAAQSLKHALYLDPAFVLGHFALGNLYTATGRPREARRSFRNALDLLKALPREEVVPESDGLGAGRLAEIVAVALASLDGIQAANV